VKKPKEKIKKWFFAHYRGRTKDAILTFLLLLSLVVAGLSLLGIISGFYFVLTTPLTMVQLLFVIPVFLFFITLLILCSILAYAADLRLTEFRPRFLTFETGKAVAVSVGLVLLIVFVFYWLDSYIGILPNTISKELAKDLLRTLIQTNGFLIAFVGVVYAQMLWAINNQQSNLEKTEIENLSDEKKETLAVKLSILDKRRNLTMALMTFVMILFVISILLSLNGMANTEMLETLNKDPYLRQPIAAMVVSLFMFVFSLVIISAKGFFDEEEVRREYRAKKKTTDSPTG
jgi:hypothetical protein